MSIWGKSDMSNFGRLNILPKRSIRIIARNKYNSHTEHFLKDFCLLKSEDVYKVNCIRLTLLFFS